MKKVLLAIIMGVMVASCTENNRVKNWGGDGTLTLPKGQKLINVTWKENQVWYLTRKMTPKDSCQIYTFHEESSWGVMEGTYTIIETK
jgi:hypothetical protein